MPSTERPRLLPTDLDDGLPKRTMEFWVESLPGEQVTAGADNDIHSANGRFTIFTVSSRLDWNHREIFLDLVVESEEGKKDFTRIVSDHRYAIYQARPGEKILSVRPEDPAGSTWVGGALPLTVKLHDWFLWKNPWQYWKVAVMRVDTDKDDDRPYVGWKGLMRLVVTFDRPLAPARGAARPG